MGHNTLQYIHNRAVTLEAKKNNTQIKQRKLIARLDINTNGKYMKCRPKDPNRWVQLERNY